MRPAVKILVPFLLGAAITGGLWIYMSRSGSAARDDLEEELAACRKVSATVKDAEAKATTATGELTTCRRELESLKTTSKAGTWFCALPDDKGASACFATRPECEAQATACREQSFAVCAGEGRCFSDIWGCVKQAPAGQTCETRR
ncbi:MAG TPA: hypothetical protein VFU21_19330 [Kofleriaceae bacterium]|nr:hypothetical protein [Kofleriaceae bacterium]